MDWAESIDQRSDEAADSRSNRWRVLGLFGGGLSTLSIFAPYVRVSDDVFGIEVGSSLTLSQVIAITAESDAFLGNLLVILVVGGAVLALAGALFSIYLVFTGGLMVTVGTGLILYQTLFDNITIVQGFVEVSTTPEYGLVLGFVGGLIALSTLVIE